MNPNQKTIQLFKCLKNNENSCKKQSLNLIRITFNYKILTINNILSSLNKINYSVCYKLFKKNRQKTNKTKLRKLLIIKHIKHKY